MTHLNTNRSTVNVNFLLRTIPGEVSDIFTILCLNTVGEIIGLFGIVANIINILIFLKQGFRESINITFMALAVTDLGALLTLQMTNILVNPWSLTASQDYSPLEVVALLSFYPHNYFLRVSGLITAFAAFERCLGVVFPLKVKYIVNRKRILMGIFCICIIASPNVFIPFYCSYLDWKVVPMFNISYFGIVYREDVRRDFDFSFAYFYTDFFLPNLTLFLLITNNFIMAVQLTAHASWRREVAGKRESLSNQISRKEQKIVQMLTKLSLIFIVCLIPQSAILTAVTFVKEFGLGGPYFDVAWLCYCVSFLLESVHSSVNIFVFYRMSSRYRNIFQMLFSSHSSICIKRVTV
ncbi:FMRFamide receptor [Biomphalaria pfeifferi]|uniref:FMRFamide receptor n=1 Tax=Biomphalaria pfeifferi TaxID=112525 RepID=A0AAD8F292_BIOPF|nr:FMRFamide receptor [Biomphalaria pfeifferi]